MSKRRNRSGAPNIPKETLDRARQQAAADRGEVVAASAIAADAAEDTAAEAVAVEEEQVEVVAKPAAPKAAPVTSASAQRRAEAARRAANRSRGGTRVSSTRKPKDRDHSAVAAMLLHPTRFVTEDELRQEYGYVATDLRAMVAVTVAMVVLLVALALIAPK
jgi:hypothetical protein